jgi:APA family basic amino acid/polyamine antiporter
VGVMNLMRVSHMVKINTGITFVHVGTMVIFVAVALFAGKWSAGNFVPFFSQGSGGPAGFLSAIPIAMLAYGAIVAIAFMVGEIRDPKKTVPKAMSIAMVTTVIIYVLMMLSTLGLITAQYLLANPSMQYTPILAAVFTQLMAFPWLVDLIVITAVLGLFTTSLVCMALTTRTFQAVAEDGLYPKALAKLNKNGVPANATILTIIICAALTALSGVVSLISLIVNLGALCTVIVVAYICLSAVSARRKNTDLTNRFKAPGGNAVSIIVLIVLVACYIPSIIQGGWQLWAWTGIYYVAGMIIYAFAARKIDAKAVKVNDKIAS